ncbi:hypothetical protein J3E74DRAFT_477852 [Bipolaris maydis]|nr:hypothetical protein J3E74DRAFT_477852 [Bipolaris maydis]
MNSSPFRIICSAVLLLWSNLSHHMFRNEYTKTTWDVLLLRIVSCCLLLALYNHAKFRQHSLWDLYETSETHFHSPKYPPLKGNDIRILALLPSTDRTAPLRGRFETHNLNNDNETSNKADKTGYEAVFYNKTTPPTMGSIVIESTIVVIPVHLQRALFWLRHAHKERRLWADAICINHSDLLEEFTQISLFPQIFKRATKAIAWVGEPKEAEEEASRPFLEALQHPSSFLLFIRSGGIAHASGLKVLIKPLKRWKLISRKRAGLCRELMLAGRISLQLGRYEIPGLFLVLLMWNYTKALRLPRLERGTNALLRLDASAALGVKASLIDFVEVFINNEKEQYDNGLFFEPWVARGVIEELLTMLRRSGKDSVSLKTLENLASLLDATYPLLEQDVNSSNRYEAYNTRGTTTKRMMIATRDRRLLEIDRILGLKQASPGSQKKDEKYSALADPFFMDYHPYWSKVVTHVANGAPGTVYPIPVIKEKKFQLNEKSRAELRHLVKSNRVDSTHSNFVKDTTDRTTKPKIHVENEIERPHSVATTEKSYRLSWTCVSDLDGLSTPFANSEKPCGHRGLDHYTEHRPGAVRELLETLQEHGIRASMEVCNPSQSKASTIRAMFERLGMAISNTCTWIRFCVLAWLGIEKWTCPSLPTTHPRLSDAVHDGMGYSKMAGRILWDFAIAWFMIVVVGSHIVLGVVKWTSQFLRILFPQLPDAVLDSSFSSKIVYGFASVAIVEAIIALCGWLVVSVPILLVIAISSHTRRITYRQDLGAEGDRSPFSKAANQSLSKIANRSPSSIATSGPTNGSLPSTSSGNVDSSNSNQPLQTSIGLSTASQATSGPQNWRFSASTAHTQVNSTNINISEDFILLCMKVKRFLTNRYDLQVSTITRDRELFEALRREYHSKFRWAYRQFSFQTVQRMSFVKFTLHARKEVDGLVSDMPPETVKHYTCDPRKPDRTPPLGSDFLMHRFSSPKDCFQDNICLRQFPKRIGERPTPGVDPDLYTGWGVHLEQDMDLQRICLVLFFGIASAGMFGLVWGICKKSLQDGFSVASFVLGSEAIAVPIRSASK